MGIQTTLPSLIGDPDPEFLRGLGTSVQPGQGQPILCNGGDEMEKALEVEGQGFSGIFINPRIQNEQGLQILRKLRELRPNTPIFFIYDPGNTPFSLEDLHHLTVTQAFTKPVTYQQLMTGLVQAQSIAMHPENELGQDLGEDPADAETVESDADFVPILAVNFLPGSASFFDVYVRLREKRYVKVLKKGDSLSMDRLESYLSKGIESLYIPRKSQEHNLNYCEKLATVIVRHQTLSSTVKISQVANHGQETANFLRQSGLDAAALAHAEKYVSNVIVLAKSLKLTKNESIRDFMGNVALVDHAVATTMVASLLGVPLGFEADRSMTVLGLSALFHDIGLKDLDPKFETEDEENFDERELALYHAHPKAGSEMLAKSREINPTVLQAVLQHHERRNRRGFPDRLGAGGINRIAEIIGISEAFVKVIQRKTKDPKVDPFREMELTEFDGFTETVIAAFRQAMPGFKSSN